MLKDFYDIESESIVNFEAFYGPKKNLVRKSVIIFSKAMYEHLLQQYDCVSA